jgi:DNA replication regulator SLD2
MEAQEREGLSERSNSLRVDLKIWEKSFAAANNGKKASRDDIKKHPDIGKTSRFGMLKRLVLNSS